MSSVLVNQCVNKTDRKTKDMDEPTHISFLPQPVKANGSQEQDLTRVDKIRVPWINSLPHLTRG